MAKFRVIVQIYKELNLEAPSALDAKRMAEEEMKKLGVTDRYNVNEAKDLDKAAQKRQAHKAKQKAHKEAQSPATDGAVEAPVV